MERYSIDKKIGSGSYAKVYLATDTMTMKKVALKLIQKRKLNYPKSLVRVNSEIENMKKLGGHQNTVTLYDSFETSEYYVLVTEYAAGGDLFNLVERQEGLDEDSGREVFKGILSGVQHCHYNGIAHRDLKLENILLAEGDIPKIADYGFSNCISPHSIYSSSVGSLLYSSPEIIQGKPYQGPECDIWSLGVILYTMLTATMPFDDSNMGDFIVKIENGEYAPPMGVSDAVEDLISRMLDPNPLTRYSVTDVLSHPWVTGSQLHTEPQSTTSELNTELANYSLQKRRFAISFNSPDAILNLLDSEIRRQFYPDPALPSPGDDFYCALDERQYSEDDIIVFV